MTHSDRDLQSADNDDATGLPALHSWPAVYALVLGAFAIWIILLSVLSRAFS